MLPNSGAAGLVSKGALASEVISVELKNIIEYPKTSKLGMHGILLSKNEQNIENPQILSDNLTMVIHVWLQTLPPPLPWLPHVRQLPMLEFAGMASPVEENTNPMPAFTSNVGRIRIAHKCSQHEKHATHPKSRRKESTALCSIHFGVGVLSCPSAEGSSFSMCSSKSMRDTA